MKAMLTAFGTAFNEVETYTSNIPRDSYLQKLLKRDCFIALAALDYNSVVGGLFAYDLQKFERNWSEIYFCRSE